MNERTPLVVILLSWKLRWHLIALFHPRTSMFSIVLSVFLARAMWYVGGPIGDTGPSR